MERKAGRIATITLGSFATEGLIACGRRDAVV
jgi:hypothetical protein